jgi:hypothetical protein
MRGCTPIVCAAIAALARAARADAQADIKKVLTAQMASVTKGDEAGFAATLDDSVFAMLPGGYAMGPTDAGAAMSRGWSKNDGLKSATLGKVVVGAKDTIAWATADAKVTFMAMGKAQVTPYRITEMFQADHGAWKAIALFASQPMKDDPTVWVDDAVRLGEDNPPGHETDGANMKDWLAHPGDLAAHLRAGNDVVALGSSAGERGDGPAAAKLLGGWKKLVFTDDWTRASTDDSTFSWLAARVQRKAKTKEYGITDEPYWVLVLAVKGDHGWEIVSVHYAQDMPSAPADANPCGN